MYFNSPYLFLLLFFPISVLCLECYVCKNQTVDKHYKNKCVETVKNCEPQQNRCLSEVKWRSKWGWTQSSEKQHVVSKRCSTSNECEELRIKYLKRCNRIWYNDWECIECCTGDRCNYYPTLGVGSTKPHLTTILSMLLLSIIIICKY